ncbi:MAG TPA: hypothetical protein VGC16_01965 [Rhizomicrobium sp.]
MAILICGAFAAAAIGLLVYAARSGRIMGRYGIIARAQYPLDFWLHVSFWSFCAALFSLLFVSFVDPRDFRPVLRLMVCEQSAWSWSCFSPPDSKRAG